MFKLLRYFSFTSVAAIAGITAVLAVLYWQHEGNDLIESAESQNVALARSFANTIWPRLSSYVTSVSGLDGDALRARPETREIHETLKTLTAGLPVLKVKIYNLDGMTVFSSQASQIGDDKSNNPGFLAAARNGKPASKLVHKGEFSTFDGGVFDRDLVESYIPIRRGDGPVEGVFELYSDVTPLIAKIEHFAGNLAIGLVLIFGTLYAVLFLIVRHADRILKHQYVDLQHVEERITAKKVSLEHQVTERVWAEQALQEANERLEQRVEERTKTLTQEIAERKRAQEALVQAKRQNEMILEAAGEGIYGLDLQGRTTFVNPAAARMIGWEPEDLIGRPQHDILHHTKPDGSPYPREECPIYAAIKDGQLHHITDEVFWRKDGTSFPVEYVSTPIRAEGELVGAVVVFTDITERKRAQEARERLALAIDGIAEHVVLFDSDDRVVLANAGWRELNKDIIETTMPGTRFEDHLRAGIKAGLLPEAVGREEEWLGWRMEHHRNPRGALEVERQDGRWILINEQRLPDGGTIHIVSDITERKRAEGKIRDLANFPEQNPDPVLRFAVDGTLLYANPASGPLLKELKCGTGESAPKDWCRMFAEVFETNSPKEFEHEFGGRTLSVVISPVPDAGYVYIYGRDITERKQAEVALRESEERFRAVVDNSPTKIHIKDLDGRYTLINRQSEILFGVTNEEARGKTSRDIFPKEVADSFMGHDEAVIKSGETIEGEEEWVQDDDVRTYLTVKFPILGATGEIAAVGAIGTDITERKRAEAHIEHLALHDSLTDLPDRFLFHDRLETAVAQSVRTGNMLGLLFLDLDDFKDVNDTHGHETGDAVLKAVAERLRSYLRESDTVGRHNTTLARIGGDEFTILLTNIAEPAGAATVAERIIEELSRPFPIGGKEIHIGVCIGIAIYPSHGDKPEDLLKKADLALYRSKAEGRNRYHFYSEQMETEILARKDLERDLRGALAEGQLSLVYQPQMDIKSGAMVGMEALLRWNHPDRGFISPVEFIPVAEATGLIVPIGEWVLRQVCAQNKAWQEAGLPAFSVAVNLSAVQFRQEDLVATVDEVLREAGLDSGDLQIEITESVLMQDGAREMLLDFRRSGIHISLDDFGTGYSSLSYLTRFPVDKIKLDSSFVHNIAHDTSSAAIIKAVVNLGHSLSMRVNVEGVETLEELGIIKSYGVDEIQGFYYSRPLSADAVPEFVAGAVASSNQAAKSA